MVHDRAEHGQDDTSPLPRTSTSGQKRSVRLTVVLRRYALPCALILLIALASSLISYAASAKPRFAAGCYFQVVIHQTQQPPLTKEEVDFSNRVSQHEVALALQGGALAAAAKTLKLGSVKDLGPITTPAVAGQLGSFVVGTLLKDPTRPPKVVNAACDQIVATVIKQRSDELAQQTKAVQSRIKTIQAEITRIQKIKPRKRTIADLAQLQTQRAALAGNATYLATILSLPPDEIGIVSHATRSKSFDPRDLKKNLVIALVIGVLLCFTYILVGEVIAERRRDHGEIALD